MTKRIIAAFALAVSCLLFMGQGQVQQSPLVVAGIVDGWAPITITTTATANLGSQYSSGYTLNQDATAGAAITYTLPAPSPGKQYCVKNSNNGSAANTGTLEILVAATATQSLIYNGTKSTSGYIISGGAGGDAACAVGISATQWEIYTEVGSWTLH
jgi:hypothetical protein